MELGQVPTRPSLLYIVQNGSWYHVHDIDEIMLLIFYFVVNPYKGRIVQVS